MSKIKIVIEDDENEFSSEFTINMAWCDEFNKWLAITTEECSSVSVHGERLEAFVAQLKAYIRTKENQQKTYVLTLENL